MKRPIFFATVVAVASIAVPTTALAAPGDSVRSVAPAGAAATKAADDAAASYWTAERMRDAIPADVATVRPGAAAAVEPAVDVGAPGGVAGVGAEQADGAARSAAITNAQTWPGSNLVAPGSTVGRVFFTKYLFGSPAGNFSCSAAVVNSPGYDTVFTAGHCVHGGPLYDWHHNWVFVPGYKNGAQPFGQWTANHFWSIKGWTQQGKHAYDVGVAIMNTKGGWHIVNKFGGHGITWNQNKLALHYVYAFGYPAEAPFNGLTLKYCTGNMFAGFSSYNRLECNMTGGASGGPWLRSFDGTWGYLNSTSSFKYDDEPEAIYGPYFGNAVKNLYNAAKND